jgi:hypothetical protein
MNQMSRLELRAVIHYLTFKNLSVAGIATELQSVYGTEVFDGLKVEAAFSGRLGGPI